MEPRQCLSGTLALFTLCAGSSAFGLHHISRVTKPDSCTGGVYSPGNPAPGPACINTAVVAQGSAFSDTRKCLFGYYVIVFILCIYMAGPIVRPFFTQKRARRCPRRASVCLRSLPKRPSSSCRTSPGAVEHRSSPAPDGRSALPSPAAISHCRSSTPSRHPDSPAG